MITIRHLFGRSRRQVLWQFGTSVVAIGVGAPRTSTANPFFAPMIALKPRPPAPDFTLSDIKGRNYSLAQLRGKVVLLNFWASWCLPCRMEMPSMELLRRSFPHKDFEILAVDLNEPRSVVLDYISQFKPQLPFPVLLDQHEHVASMFRIQGPPTSFLVDRSGRLAYTVTGARNYMNRRILTIISREIMKRGVDR